MPKNYAAYSPFPEIQGTVHSDKVRSLGLSWKEKLGANVIYFDGRGGKLSKLRPDCPLYIISHCDAGSSTVSDNAVPPNTLTATQLAARLAHEGLSRHHHVIKLYACKAALGADKGAITGSFAEQFRRALDQQHYVGTELYGYARTVSSVNQDGHRCAMRRQRNPDGGGYLTDEAGNELYEYEVVDDPTSPTGKRPARAKDFRVQMPSSQQPAPKTWCVGQIQKFGPAKTPQFGSRRPPVAAMRQNFGQIPYMGPPQRPPSPVPQQGGPAMRTDHGMIPAGVRGALPPRPPRP